MTGARGEVFDLGYQHYLGPREGRTQARKALWLNGVRTALGLGRGWPSKVLPALLFVAVMIPAVVMSIIASVADFGDVLPDHADYYRVVVVVLTLASAIIAPELLCPDRREGVLSLYLVRPLTTSDYVLGRWLAFFSVSLALVLFGQVILFIGLTLASSDSPEYVRDNWLDIPRFLGAGFVVALFTTTIPMAVSAFTTRRAYAAAFVIVLYVISAPIASGLASCEHGNDDAPRSEVCEPPTGDAAKWFALISIPEVPMHVNDMIFDEEGDSDFAELIDELPNVVPIGWYLILTGIPGLVLWWRYQRIRA